MSEIVLEVGPATVRGPGQVADEQVSTALAFIDEDLVLVDDRAVPTAELWRDVVRSAGGSGLGSLDTLDVFDTLVLVCPAWWAPARIALVHDVGREVAVNVVVLERATLLTGKLADPDGTVVEITDEFVAVTYPDVADITDAPVVAVPRLGDADQVAEEVVARIGLASVVLIDAPAGVVEAAALAAGIAHRLRAAGVTASVTDPDWVLRSRRRSGSAGRGLARPTVRVGGRAAAISVAAVLVTAALCAASLVERDTGSVPPHDVPMMLLVEGRVAVKVPALWSAERVTSGTGSSRLQIVSPADDGAALHLTQSPVPEGQTLDTAAAVLRNALEEQPAGVFVDFDPADRRFGDPVVTYREVRARHHIQWVVQLDGSVRIAIGCQSPPGHEDLVRSVCTHAVDSAHAVF